jgi:DNA-binding Lrp family transcriptional regulator
MCIPTWGRGEPPVSAYILIQTEVGKAGHVTDMVRGIDGIVSVDPVTGPYDIVARAEAQDLDLLAKGTVMPMQELDGITRTLTCPILQL